MQAAASKVATKARCLACKPVFKTAGDKRRCWWKYHARAKNLQPLLLSQYVKVRFDGIELNNVFKIEPSSVHDNKVWVNDGGELDIRPVNIAFRSAEYVLIDQGLKNDDEIVTSNLGAPVNRMAIRTNERTNEAAK